MRKALIASLAVDRRPVVAATATGRSTAPRRPPRQSPAARRTSWACSTPTATLTVGADNPAYPPWFGGDEKTKPWKVSDPYSGKGYESAVAYAVAKQLGFSKAQVKWTVVAVQQLVPARARSRSTSTSRRSRTARQRAKAVDFSKGYYFVNQSVVGRKGKPIASAQSIAALKKYKLGAQIGTTSSTTSST